MFPVLSIITEFYLRNSHAFKGGLGNNKKIPFL